MVFLPCGRRNLVHVKYQPCAEEKVINPTEQHPEYGPLIASSIITTPLLITSFVWLLGNRIRDADGIVVVLLSLTALLTAVNVSLGIRLWRQLRSLEQSRYVQYIENVSGSEESAHLSCWLNRVEMEDDEVEHHHTQQPAIA